MYGTDPAAQGWFDRTTWLRIGILDGLGLGRLTLIG
jgi:hypothetical protein